MAGMVKERLEPQPEGEGAWGDLSREEEADLGRAHCGQRLDHAELRVDGESRLSTGGEPGLCERAWKGGQLEGLDPAVDESRIWARDSEGSGLGEVTLAGTPRPAPEAAWPHSEQRGGGWLGDPVSCSSQEPRAPDVGSATQNHGARCGGRPRASPGQYQPPSGPPGRLLLGEAGFLSRPPGGHLGSRLPSPAASGLGSPALVCLGPHLPSAHLEVGGCLIVVEPYGAETRSLHLRQSGSSPARLRAERAHR